MTEKVTAIIPARLSSTRFPRKPLAKILGLPMIEHVRRRTCLAKTVDEVYVATCDQEIMNVVTHFGGKAILTANTHVRCTDRVEEAAQKLHADIIVIVQGDEPLCMPPLISSVISPLLQNKDLPCANVISKICDTKTFHDPDIVKAVLDQKNNIIYFSRLPIPHRGNPFKNFLYRQTGLSAFRKAFLHQFSKLNPTPLEILESIDFLRIIEYGFSIKAVISDPKTTQGLIAVDRPQHLKQVEKILEKNPAQKRLHQHISHT